MAYLPRAPPGGWRIAFIYTLHDGDGRHPRYVGASVVPATRYSDHVRNSERAIPGGIDANRTRRWIHDAIAAGKRIQMDIIQTVPIHETKAAEQEWIRRLREQGHDLTNAKRGPSYPRRLMQCRP